MDRSGEVSGITGYQGVGQKRSWWRRFGWRNLGYLVFVVALVPLGATIETLSEPTPEGGFGIVVAWATGFLGSLGFLLVNMVLTVIAVLRRRAVGKPLIACALSGSVIACTLLLIVI